MYLAILAELQAGFSIKLDVFTIIYTLVVQIAFCIEIVQKIETFPKLLEHLMGVEYNSSANFHPEFLLVFL